MNKNYEYKQQIGKLFDHAAPSYGKEGSSYFHYFAEKLVQHTPLCTGMHILDVATGRGAILFRAAQKIGPDGKAIGIDLSQQMVTETQNELFSFSHIQIQQMDAENLQFANELFDVVFCGFALFFMPDIKKVLQECKRVLKNTGILAISTWGARDHCYTALRELAKECGINPQVSIHSSQNHEQLVKIVTEAGFSEIHLIPDTYDHVYPTIQVWWNSLWSHGTRGILEQLSEEQLKNCYSEMHKKLQPLLQADGLHEKISAWYIIAYKSTQISYEES